MFNQPPIGDWNVPIAREMGLIFYNALSLLTNHFCGLERFERYRSYDSYACTDYR
jgi:hypothetical protein